MKDCNIFFYVIQEGCGRYCLRPRPSQPKPSNPILEFESTAMFASTVRHRQALSQRKSLALRTALIQGDFDDSASDAVQIMDEDEQGSED